ncbi:tail protein X [Testudinibacter aquarius]|uniref:Phage tail protein n=1 Tax=Testudinibacter aquarius TaxID=1524974 RepID=A0A4R3Y647_9PAST|nr:tail protein X [Testudinibacter aquarius]KAE9526076.1 phage tail protein [Testudinibacter aquarius]TCV87270.1 phage tail protein X [Testudinibacter aquarius]TNG87519.1 phage tail protein [Testudinibacter aquarius]
MATVYAQQHDSLDAIVYRYFGKTAGLVERVLELNPKLADHITLEIGTAVILPEVEQTQAAERSILQLWD